MTDILIRGVEMPKNCHTCWYEKCGKVIELVSSGKNPWKTRHPGCPLVELPEHGDLIDRDAFNVFICKSCGDRCNCESIETDCVSCESAFRCDFVPILKTAPVIVPSNKEEST